MSKKLLDKFFKENPTEYDNKTPSAPALAHFFLELDNNPKANEKIQEILDKELTISQPGREEKIAAETKEIESADNYEQIVRIMRRNTDPLNQHILINKAMTFENEIVPDIVRRLKTSMNDGFIESTIRILNKSSKNIADEIMGYYDDMRNPYAQSMALVLLGFKVDETHIPWLIEKYNALKRLYPNKSYCEGAYYALYEIENRFY